MAMDIDRDPRPGGEAPGDGSDPPADADRRFGPVSRRERMGIESTSDRVAASIRDGASAREQASAREHAVPAPRPAPHRLLAWLLAGTALGIVVLLWVVGQTGPPWTLEELLLARTGSPTQATAPLSGRVSTALESEEVSEPVKLALVDELARDPSETATDALLRAAHNSSLLISMAAVKGLTGRPCDLLEPQLTELLVDDSWQRRAWAAKVLGESGCEDAGETLSNRWRSEPDARVREQIADAMTALRAVHAQ